jgi:hypothetical protein
MSSTSTARRIGATFAAVLVAVMTLPARSAHAGVQVSFFKLKDKSLQAFFEDASDDGCFVSQTTISFSESVTQTGGPPIIGAPTTLVDVVYSNACTGEFFELSGGTTTQTVHIANDLSSATLSAVATVTDGGSLSADVTMSVTWTANGPTQVAKDTIVTRDANTITVERFDFESRPADVSGTVAALLPVQGGPTDFDLSRFPEGGTVGKNRDSQRTVTFLHGHH